MVILHIKSQAGSFSLCQYYFSNAEINKLHIHFKSCLNLPWFHFEARTDASNLCSYKIDHIVSRYMDASTVEITYE